MESSALPSQQTTRIEVDGRQLDAELGVSVAAALLRAGVRTLHRSPGGFPRGAFCMMGICQECLVEIDGIRRQACLVAVGPDMHIVTGQSA